MKTKTIKTCSIILLVFFGATSITFAQSTNPNFWAKDGNSTTGNGNFFGTFYLAPINVYTNSTFRAQFTGPNALTNGLYPGAGLRMIDPSGAASHLDIWCGGSNTTHIKWAGSGEISGQNNRFEIIGHFGGIWLNGQTTIAGPARIFFNIDGTECGRFNATANQRFMRIGLNPSNIDAARRLEVFDNANAPQFRITKNAGIFYTDFQTTATGDLAILPVNTAAVNQNRFVGIQTITQGNTLEINSQAAGSATLNNDPGGQGTGFSGLRFSDLKLSSIP